MFMSLHECRVVFDFLGFVSLFFMCRGHVTTICFSRTFTWGGLGQFMTPESYASHPLYQAADDNLFQGDTHLLGGSAYPLQR